MSLSGTLRTLLALLALVTLALKYAVERHARTSIVPLMERPE